MPKSKSRKSAYSKNRALKSNLIIRCILTDEGMEYRTTLNTPPQKGKIISGLVETPASAIAVREYNEKYRKIIDQLKDTEINVENKETLRKELQSLIEHSITPKLRPGKVRAVAYQYNTNISKYRVTCESLN